MAVQPTALKIVHMTTSFHSMLVGSALDRSAVSQFTQADAQTQAQVIKNLANSATPPELVRLEAALSTAVPRAASPQSQSHISAAAHWWGFQIFIPESVMQQLNQAPGLFSAVLGLLAPVLVGPLAVVLGIVAGFIAAEIAAMKAVDKGKGVELSATWLAPIILIPSAL